MAQKLRIAGVLPHSLPIPVHAAPRAALAPGARSRCQFDDIDAQAQSLDGWNQSYLQLSRGTFQGGVQRLKMEGVGLFIEDLQQAVHQTGKVQSDVAAFGVPIVLDGDSQFCGQAGDTSRLHVFSGTDGFEFRSPQRHIMLGIEVDVPLFEAHCPETWEGDPIRFLGKARLHAGDVAATQALRGFALGLFEDAAQQARLAQDALYRAQVREELLGHLLAALSPSGRPSGGTGRAAVTAAHAALEARACEWVLSRLDDPPTVGEMCETLGVSRRTLQNCFQATWGMGPLTWLNTLRLNVVRRHLKYASSVTDVATQFGFCHFGHFACDYKDLFGELPSQTLHRYRTGSGYMAM